MMMMMIIIIIDVKGKFHPITDHEGPEGEQTYDFTLSVASALDVQSHAPAALRREKRNGTPCTGGWVDLRARQDRCGKSRPAGIRSPDRPSRRKSNTNDDDDDDDNNNNNNNNNNNTIKAVVLQINTSA